MEDLQERQENEVIVLKSIYSQYFIDLRESNLNNNVTHKNHKKSNHQINSNLNVPLIRITLFPVNSQSQHEIKQVYVQIDLKIKFTPGYPNELPIINLENEKGLSLDLVKILHRQLVKKANELKGREMIYELCQDVQEFLYNHNKPPTKSFYEQRLENQQIIQKQQLEESFFDAEKRKCEDQLIADIDQAIDLKRKMLQMERKKEKMLEKRERLLSNNSPSSRTSKNDSESDPKESLSEILPRVLTAKLAQEQQSQQQTQNNLNQTFKPFQIDFKEPNSFKINCIKLLSYNQENSFCIYRGIEMNTNEIFDIYEWKISLEKNKIFEKKKLDQCLTEMHKIEDDFKNLAKLNNKLLVKYLAYKYFKETDKNYFIVQICVEYVEGSTIELFINKKQSYIVLDSTLKTFTVQLINALDYLHSNHVIHRDLKPSCVHIERNSLDLKLSDYGIVKKLNNLNDIVSNEAANTMTGNVRSDIHQLGLIVLSLCMGEEVKEYHPQVPTSLPPELKSFISICLKDLDKIDCKYLRNHPYILKSPDKNSNPYNTALFKRTTSIHYDDDEDGMKSFTDYSSHSRLNTEFEVIGVVGQGAFGEVLKVRNKLDLRFYAIKRIRINPNSKHYNKLITREIKLLSRLNHENVVRYYSTWVEQSNESNDTKHKSLSQSETYTSIDEESESDKDSDESSSDDESNQGCIAWSRKESSDSNGLSQVNNSFSDFSSSDNESIHSTNSSNSDSNYHSKFFSKSSNNIPVSFSLNSKNESDESVIFAEASGDNLKSIKPQKSNLKTGNSNKVELKNANKSKKNVDFADKKEDNLKKQYIYIQMEYCGGKTLKDLIENGLHKNEEKVWCLFREILQGLNHIHEQGMIHRDLKPGNVLIDTSGHAKIGDFGLATSRFKMQKENITAPSNSGGMGEIVLEDNLAMNSLTSLNATDSLQLDSLSLSGAVGTALYVAPELMQPLTKNKYVYTQKVDIYSLGIMFYEMCFPFSTNMERIDVLQYLRQKDAEIKCHVNNKKDKYENQLCLIKLMLNHDPSVRPTAKELLLNEMIPRKADEIALDELLKYSFNNKQSTNYKKILKAVFDQKNTKIEDASFDATNCKLPTSFRVLQIREHVYNQLIKIFQKHGGYMLSYPFLTPCNEMFDDFNNVFKLTDASGLVLCLPYNHRIPFARYLARSGCTNIKRYYIGKVFTEKLKLTSLHPREHMEASFDIVTSSQFDCLPEIEILSVMNDVINSFSELIDQNYILCINHSNLLNAIFYHCGISEINQKNIYYLLAEYNNKLIKSYDASKENRVNWFKDRLPHLNLNEHTIERLLNFLLKNGEPEKILSELRTLTKSDSHYSKLAKEGINQLKLILSNLSIIDLKMRIVLSPSFVLPIISHPYEYSGFTFQLLARRKNNKNEFDILASGGRYDHMISKFRNKQIAPQCAVGLSFDFEKIVFIVNEKSKQNTFRPELVVCSLNDNSNQTNVNLAQNSLTQINQTSLNLKSTKKLNNSSSTNLLQLNSTNSLIQQDIKNRLRLFKQLSIMNRNFNFSTHMIHEKFSSVEDIDEYCKKHCISSYIYINDTSSIFTSQIFSHHQLLNPMSNSSNSSLNEQAESNQNSSNSSLSSSPTNTSYLKLRSLIDKGFKYLDKKLNLSDFLINSNALINQMGSYVAMNSNSIQYHLIPFLSISSSSSNALQPTNIGSITSINQAISNVTQTSSYIDFIQTLFNSQTISSSSSYVASSPAQTTSLSSVSSTSTLNFMSQINVTILLEPANRQQNTNISSRKKLELQVVSKLNHIFSIFNSKTRIELIIIETPEIVIQALANGLHLEMDESSFSYNWNQCLEKLNNLKYRKQLCNFNLDVIIHDLRYLKRSKVFVLYSIKSDQFKLIVAP